MKKFILAAIVTLGFAAPILAQDSPAGYYDRRPVHVGHQWDQWSGSRGVLGPRYGYNYGYGLPLFPGLGAIFGSPDHVHFVTVRMPDGSKRKMIDCGPHRTPVNIGISCNGRPVEQVIEEQSSQPVSVQQGPQTFTDCTTTSWSDAGGFHSWQSGTGCVKPEKRVDTNNPACILRYREVKGKPPQPVYATKPEDCHA